MTTNAVTKSAALPVLLIEDEPAVMAYVRATLERSGYSVLDRRARVGVATRASAAAPALVRAWLARRPHQTHHASVCNASENPNSRSSTGA